ncbi:hypothetical protein ACHAQH_008781 [Verticillium albo-atrum]
MIPSIKWLGTACVWSATAVLTFTSAVSAREEFYSELKACPVTCVSTTDSSQWTLYSSLSRLTYCEEPLLFEVSLSGEPAKRSQLTRVRACTAGEPAEKIDTILPDPVDGGGTFDQNKLVRRSGECPAATSNSTTVELANWGQRSSSGQDIALIALRELQKWVQAKEGCQKGPTVSFGYFNGTVLGYFAGERVDNAAAAAGLIKKLASDVSDNGVPERLLMQHCGQENKTNISGGVTAGVVVDSQGGFVAVQKVVREWHVGNCVGDAAATEQLRDTPLKFFPTLESPEAPESFSFEVLEQRQGPAECRWIRVEQHELCGDLARRCGITQQLYDQYNNQPRHCNTLMPGQPVCCSGGRLPDLRPKPNPNGSCYAYTVQPDWFCARIAAEFGLTVQEIFDFNKNTWGWSGCEPLGLGITICLSPGRPPMPAPVDNAVCGPTKPGSRPPIFTQTLADVSPCPLRTCCNTWGQCGTTADFCIKTESETGAPGTAAPGTHGCVQNCGMDIVNNSEPPKTVRKLGYFEGWNMGRPCLHMNVSAVENHREQYTDIHFSFAHVSPGPVFGVVIPEDVLDQWREFLAMDASFRKVLAFGGWSFSTEPATYKIFREATAPANRERFAQNCAVFAVFHGLDGIDFDWEYPGAPDMPGIEPGGSAEGTNYLGFLETVRGILPDQMSLSIAAPASFWYLKPFPIDVMAKHLDYIVYMTYDLHGQWDAGNQWANPGCATGNCLRSHVNWTETENALAMITKAGVPANKVLMGVATYGRSFKMTQAGCKGPDCKFLGDRMNSQAKPGRCTGTGGYLANAEIYEMLGGPGVSWDFDDKSRSDITVYDRTEYVAWMSQGEREWREAKARELNFGGTIEWAVDLQDFLDDGGVTKPRDKRLWELPPPCELNSPHDNFDDLLDDDSIPGYCLPRYGLEILHDMAAKAHITFERIKNDDWERTFDFYRDVVIRGGPLRLETWIFENAGSYFDCQLEWTRRCCRVCATTGNGDCKGCLGNNHPSCSSNHEEDWAAGGVTASEPVSCPTADRRAGDIRYNVKPGMSNALYAAILKDIGMSRDQISWGSRPYSHTVIGDSSQNCPTIGGSNCRTSRLLNTPLVNSPVWRRNAVESPVTIIEESLGGSLNLSSTLYGAVLGNFIGVVTHNPGDLLEALALPVLMLTEAVEYMEEAHKIGKEAIAEHDKSLGLLIAQLVFFIIPFIGKWASAAFFGRKLETLIRVGANVAGDAGMVGVDVYKIVDTDSNADRIMLGLGIAITGMGTITNFPSLRDLGIRHANNIPANAFGRYSDRGTHVIQQVRTVRDRPVDFCVMSGALPW